MFHTSSERETVREMKEALCAVAPCAEGAERFGGGAGGGGAAGEPGAAVAYKLPDGAVINVRARGGRPAAAASVRITPRAAHRSARSW